MAKTTRHGGGTNASEGTVVTRPKGAPRSQRKPKQTGDSVYDGWKVDKLRDELRGRELPTTGKKAELVARLVESDRADGVDELVRAGYDPDAVAEAVNGAPDGGGDQDADDSGGESEPE